MCAVLLRLPFHGMWTDLPALVNSIRKVGYAWPPEFCMAAPELDRSSVGRVPILQVQADTRQDAMRSLVSTGVGNFPEVDTRRRPGCGADSGCRGRPVCGSGCGGCVTCCSSGRFLQKSLALCIILHMPNMTLWSHVVMMVLRRTMRLHSSGTRSGGNLINHPYLPRTSIATSNTNDALWRDVKWMLMIVAHEGGKVCGWEGVVWHIDIEDRL
mmetsp:Transcript_11163/g.18525  ORF Transcript_11163/g.18525 Transcript_11163/m.18525 type:complete len:213 (+) Transcript_11163:123-761(+)